MAEDDQKIQETRIRYIHHKVGPDVGIQSNSVSKSVHQLTLHSMSTDTVIMEKTEDSIVISMRILNINYRRITPSFFNEYTSIRRLDIGCPISIYWLFRNLAYLPRLEFIRFGRQTFHEKGDEETCNQPCRESKTVHTLEINYDQHVYSGLSDSNRKSLDSKLRTVLQLAPKHFPSLNNCIIYVPKNLESDLDLFSQSFPGIYSIAEKRSRYVDGPITFATITQPSNSHRRSRYHARRHSNHSGSSNFNSPCYDDRPDIHSPMSRSSNDGFDYTRHPKVERREEEIEDIEVFDNSPSASSGFHSFRPASSSSHSSASEAAGRGHHSTEPSPSTSSSSVFGSGVGERASHGHRDNYNGNSMSPSSRGEDRAGRKRRAREPSPSMLN